MSRAEREPEGMGVPTGSTTTDHSASSPSESRDNYAVNPAEQVAEATAFLRALMRFGEVHELRAPGLGNGYYNDPDRAAQAAVGFDRMNASRQEPVGGVYLT